MIEQTARQLYQISGKSTLATWCVSAYSRTEVIFPSLTVNDILSGPPVRARCLQLERLATLTE